MNSGILEYGDISLRKTKPSDVNLLVYHWDMLILTEYPVKQKIDKSMISLTDLGELEMIRSCCSYILVLLVDQLIMLTVNRYISYLPPPSYYGGFLTPPPPGKGSATNPGRENGHC